MAAFSEERAPSRPFCCWILSAIVRVRSSGKGWEVVRKSPNPGRDERPACHFVRLMQTDPCGGEN